MNDIKKWLDRGEILAIKGPRQSGKTTLLYIIRDYLIHTKRVKEENIIYITLEDRDTLDAFSSDPKEFVKSYISRNMNERWYFLIDEFHYLPEGGQKLKLLYDIFENVKFIITGSSSLELTGGTSRYLVGRLFSFHLFQFSFGEFLQTKERHIYNTYLENSKIIQRFLTEGEGLVEKREIFEKEFARYFEEYARFGGYPEVVKANDIETRQMILKNIYDTYITRDIVDLLRIEDVSTFRTTVTLLASGAGGLINYNTLVLDAGSYFRQIKHYLSVLEETFVIRILRPYYSNIASELKKNPRVYFVDTGLRNYIIKNFNELRLRDDAGRLIENVVLSQLCQHIEGELIKFWRTTGGAEVDFVIQLGEEVVPVEVKYSKLKAPEISRGFRNFINRYKPRRAVILTRGLWARAEINNTEIGFFPVWYI